LAFRFNAKQEKIPFFRFKGKQFSLGFILFRFGIENEKRTLYWTGHCFETLSVDPHNSDVGCSQRRSDMASGPGL
jgi:hypothetical protein